LLQKDRGTSEGGTHILGERYACMLRGTVLTRSPRTAKTPLQAPLHRSPPQSATLTTMAGTRVFCGGLDERANQQDLEAEVRTHITPHAAHLGPHLPLHPGLPDQRVHRALCAQFAPPMRLGGPHGAGGDR
jgi:hypothetical protein